MPTLKEIKGRIASVRSTLKITSAMKLVSSAKLRKAQRAIESMRPYEQQLQAILSTLQGNPGTDPAVFVPGTPGNDPAGTRKADFVPGQGDGAVAIVAIASNSSLCGGFNAAAVNKVRSIRKVGDTVYSVGRKMADSMRRDGFPSPEDYTDLSEHPAYAPAAALVEKLAADYAAGRIGGAVLVYNHFVSTARQVPVAEVLLGDSSTTLGMTGNMAGMTEDTAGMTEGTAEMTGGKRAVILSEGEESADVIVEPSRRELLGLLLPKTLKLKLYAALLDSAAAEHAARTVAMQNATDNGEKLLEELTLEYNKGRQQKITSEILDLAGGQAEQ